MAGFASFDEFVTSITTNNQFVRTDWYKITGGTAYTIGRWYDHSILAGFPVATLLTGGTNLAFQSRSESAYGIPHGGNVSPASKHLVNMSAFSSVATAVPSVLQLVDVLGFEKIENHFEKDGITIIKLVNPVEYYLFDVKVEHIHRIQNLWFEHTGKEIIELF